jgi:N6-L-threonylcarbamoyladenine synthase
LKTAVKIKIDKMEHIAEQDKYDVCASFQRVVVKILINRLENIFNANILNRSIRDVVISGGVSANQFIKINMQKICEKYGFNLVTPPLKLCTDNGVMIANAGLERFLLGKIDSLLITPKSRWELEEIK